MRNLALFLLLSTALHANETAGEKNVPRFVTLKSDKVNVRLGPTRDHDIGHVYQKAGLPVEVTAEHDTWRRIRDWEGTEGWVQQSLLTSQKRSVMVRASDKLNFPLYDTAQLNGKVVATIEPRVTATAKSCNLKACLVSGQGFEGWIDQSKLWGVYPNEKF